METRVSVPTFCCPVPSGQMQVYLCAFVGPDTAFLGQPRGQVQEHGALDEAVRPAQAVDKTGQDTLHHLWVFAYGLREGAVLRGEALGGLHVDGANLSDVLHPAKRVRRRSRHRS